ncbi:hypothetical protein SAMN02745671_01656 [Anaerovibrio lipolyticus DSM 3074]|uniref:Uncharacterized protein n=1 Tax=Anaerovibrio lipolyticus DSM 3074 TaxID=1120997 RepID=A0A1M6DYG8_9FIRM|nr:hypothetical protein [Anaerovibrio lipolyticus]SHI78304.1 hypothetical protein SAMN02745671_01656 [Anaerovibrio lipolyticus DSM 3074]
MRISLIRGMLLTCLLTLVMVVSSTVADAAIHFTDNYGYKCVLDYNNTGAKGKYVIDARGSKLLFDYNPNTHEFICYDGNRVKAVRKFRGRDSIISKSINSSFPDGVYDKGRDGDYYHEITGDGIYGSTIMGFLHFLDAGGNLGNSKPSSPTNGKTGGNQGNNKSITIEINRDIGATVRKGSADVPVVLMNNSNRRYYFEYVDWTLILKDRNGNPIGTFTKRENLNGNLNAHSTVKRNVHFEDSRIPNHFDMPITLSWSYHGKWN